ncbi:hypothetical protein NQ318_023014 [Aromia moschata]|uniref:Insulin-like domain-containing protein n=1 Tax=Aromia moschata TaxID=1265417 RepID=A0AAV8YET0_9CUCU|nr:hypothetical protein NQ318_023014 [Aromia moschata]
MNFRTIFILMVLNIAYICGSPYLNVMRAKRSRVCGSELRKMLHLVCRGNYASPQKKSYDYDYDSEYRSRKPERDYPFVPKEWATSFIPQRLRRDGVVNECCYKSCSIEEMQTFCSPE